MKGNRTRKALMVYIGRLLHNEAVSISIIYAVFGIIWISMSDRLLKYFFREFDQYANFQTYKGWFYILVTTLLVFVLIYKRTLRLKNENRKTAAAYDKLRKTHEELVKLEAELIYQKKLTDSIIEEAPVFIVTHDENSIYSFNPYSQQVSGYIDEDFKDKSWMELLIPEEYRQKVEVVFSQIRTDKHYRNYEFPIKAKDGSMINILWNSNLLTSPSNPENSFFVSFGVNITERKSYEKKIRHLAYYDSLTGLPNRARFELEINKHLCQEQPESFKIAYIDIDNFKMINDSMGHQVGDRFLTYLGECFRLEIKEPHYVARLGGDEFALLLFCSTRDELMKHLQLIKQRITKTWSIENYQFFISMSTGVVSYPEDGQDAAALLKNADIAMYQAKKEGKNRVLFYQEQIRDINFKQLNLINSLQYGIEEEQFVLYYQPQFTLLTGKINGVEALVRWIHPKEGFISPAEFIPIAEDSGQIYTLERWILSTALKQKKIWEEQGITDIVMSINLSGKSLTSIINFNELEQIIDNIKVDYSKVVIEITETANISDVEIVINHLNRLKMRGIRIALDDFGTGYSSLNYLKKFPINIIKLDRSFINAINENGIDTLLMKNILTLAHDLGFEVIAEGIEKIEQLEYLKSHYCSSGQGYLLSRPAPENKVQELIKSGYFFEA